MKRLAAVAFVAALFAGVAIAGLSRHGGLQRPLTLRGGSATSPLLGLHYGGRQAWLVRLDPKTLKARPGRRFGLEEFSRSWAFSPDRSRLAFGTTSGDAIACCPARVRIVDVRTLRRVRDLSLGLSGGVVYVHWAAPDRLLALVRTLEDPGNDDPPPVTDRVVVVDPTTGAVHATESLDGRVIALARSERSLILLLGGRSYRSYGPVRLMVADADGRLASVVLEQTRAGWHETADEVPREEGAAVALDPDAGRAYAVAAGAPVAEVDLATLAVEYHTPSQPVSLLGRLHDWIEPSAQAKGPLEGSWRYATWLGDGRLAVYGRDMSTYQAGDGLFVRQRPSGLVVIDTRDWTAHVVDPQASSVLVANGALLSWGWAWNGGTERATGAGLNVYDRAGLLRLHLFGRRVVYDAQVVGSRAFVSAKNLYKRYAVVDLRSGRQVRTIRSEEPALVLSSAGPSFYG